MVYHKAYGLSILRTQKKRIFKVGERIGDQLLLIQSLFRKGNRREAVISIGGAVADPVGGIVAGGVLGSLQALLQPHTALHLLHGSENMKELIHRFRALGRMRGIEVNEGASNEARGGGKISGKPHSSHASAVSGKGKRGAEATGTGLRGQISIVGQKLGLNAKWRLVGQRAVGIRVDLKPFGGGFQREAFGGIRQQPMQAGGGKLWKKGVVGEIDVSESLFGFSYRSKLPQKPRDQFKLSQIVMAVLRRTVNCAFGKIQARHTKPMLVDGIKIEGIALRDESDAEEGKMLPKGWKMPKIERE